MGKLNEERARRINCVENSLCIVGGRSELPFPPSLPTNFPVMRRKMCRYENAWHLLCKIEYFHVFFVKAAKEQAKYMTACIFMCFHGFEVAKKGRKIKQNCW